MQVFISFASEQKESAELIAVALRERGYKVFFSKDTLPAAQSYDLRIEKAVKSSDLFVFLVSPESVTKGKYTLTELSFARDQWSNPSGHILPVMIAPTEIGKIPVYLRAVSIFEPEGNVAADTAAQVDKILQANRSARHGPASPRAGLATGALSYRRDYVLADRVANSVPHFARQVWRSRRYQRCPAFFLERSSRSLTGSSEFATSCIWASSSPSR